MTRIIFGLITTIAAMFVSGVLFESDEALLFGGLAAAAVSTVLPVQTFVISIFGAVFTVLYAGFELNWILSLFLSFWLIPMLFMSGLIGAANLMQREPPRSEE